MSRIAYVNGSYLPHAQAAVHIEDRGYQFADGVYEVCELMDHKIVDMTRHLDRLDRSLRELEIPWPLTRAALQIVMREIARRNKIANGLIYLQITRGVAPRDHMFPPSGTPAALVLTAKSTRPPTKDAKLTGIDVITVPDNRWERVDIKTVSLLPNVLAREAARRQDAAEAWFVDDNGDVTEGSSTNAWIITKDNELVTRPAQDGILRGITRQGVIDAVHTLGLKLVERPFTPDEAQQAKESFVTSATKTVKPVVRIDGVSVGNGEPGEITTKLRSVFHQHTEISSSFTKNF